MKKVITSLFLIVGIAGSSFAAGKSINDNPLRDELSNFTPSQHEWYRVASSRAVASALETEATGISAARPAVLLETSSYVYRAGEPAGVLVSYDPNGYSSPVTLYLYRQNRMTGAKEYYNAFSAAFGLSGMEMDLFGSNGVPVAIGLPALSDFELFGPAGGLGGSIMTPTGQTGRYQYVLEVRNANGSRILSSSQAKFNNVDAIVPVQGSISASTTLSASNAYVLVGGVFVESGATLTIQPGTVIYGDSATKGFLVIDRGAKINANGTAMNPIVMTSDQPVGERGRSDWGGLIINGRAPVNIGEGIGEGGTRSYGGSNPADDSGVLRYLRVEFAGFELSPDNELNGIAFQGVGSGTVAEHLQVHFNKDDGMEFFGGTVNAKYILLTSNGDDNIDWVEGWVGSLQFAAVVQSGDDADQGIEADNKELQNNITPRSNPNVYNVTLIGGANSGPESDDGILLREGTAGKIYNSIVMGFGEAGIAIRQATTFAQVDAGDLIVDHNIFWNNTEVYDSNSDGTLTADGAATRNLIENVWTKNRMVDPMLAAPFMLMQPDLRPLEGSPALDARFVRTPPDNGFFDTTVDYVGAVSPGNNWLLSGWATFSDN